ncbi:secreted RxLR effector protein 161-like [Pistacia vera]|uniref:secreted RxLR effector protein 161-like n=1 Tax=Pistacia vera TaxID=55513 RepID=UPI0012636EB3|nr:secreted RxLR effector protein 161-like [Pistacia vera]
MIEDFKKSMMHEFEMTDLGLMSYIIGIEVIQKEDGIFICQKRQIAGSLRYLTCSKLDISYGVGLISKFLEFPRQSHMKVAKRIMRYIKGTFDHGLSYSSSNNCVLVDYSDGDCGGDIDDCRSTSGYCFKYGSTACSWPSKKQSIVALSTCEAEYVVIASSACQVVWLRNLLSQIHCSIEGPMKIFVDNTSTIRLAKNLVTHGRSKHISTRFIS